MQRIFIFLLALFLFVSWSFLYIFSLEDKIAHAIISMGTGLLFFWVVIGGASMYLLRGKTKAFVESIAINWQIKFVLFAVALAMIEEAIAVTMTNLAPFFDVEIGQAYITASTNYWDVILRHSVIVFIPFFIAWAWILKRYKFSPFWVFLLFGLNGIIAESLSFGLQNPIQLAFWIFVYGLMIYLPAYTIPQERGASTPKFWHGILAFFLPLLAGMIWSFFFNIIFSNHPSIHFPPI
jgi:hypothetical protein